MPDLTGKVAVVTGGGGVLCGAMSVALAQQGAAVAVLDLSEEAAQHVVDRIRAQGGRAIAVSANVLSKESLLARGRADPRRAGVGRHPDQWGGRQQARRDGQPRPVLL